MEPCQSLFEDGLIVLEVLTDHLRDIMWEVPVKGVDGMTLVGEVISDNHSGGL